MDDFSPAQLFLRLKSEGYKVAFLGKAFFGLENCLFRGADAEGKGEEQKRKMGREGWKIFGRKYNRIYAVVGFLEHHSNSSIVSCDILFIEIAQISSKRKDDIFVEKIWRKCVTSRSMKTAINFFAFYRTTNLNS